MCLAHNGVRRVGKVARVERDWPSKHEIMGSKPSLCEDHCPPLEVGDLSEIGNLSSVRKSKAIRSVQERPGD